MHACMLSGFSLSQHFVAPWTVACQAPLSMEFSRQEPWSGLPFPPPGDLLNPGIEPTSEFPAAFQEDTLPTEPPGKSLREDHYTLSQAFILGSSNL